MGGKGGHSAHFSFGRRLAERAGGWVDKGGHRRPYQGGTAPYKEGAHKVGGGGLVRGYGPLQGVLRPGFEPGSPARKADILGRTRRPERTSIEQVKV